MRKSGDEPGCAVCGKDSSAEDVVEDAANERALRFKCGSGHAVLHFAQRETDLGVVLEVCLLNVFDLLGTADIDRTNSPGQRDRHSARKKAGQPRSRRRLSSAPHPSPNSARLRVNHSRTFSERVKASGRLPTRG